MTTTSSDAAPLKEIQKLIWSQGDFQQLARQVMPAAEALAEASGVTAGEHVLDVAAGTGNAAVAAARRGASVVASDLTPKMVAVGRERTEAEGLEIEWVEADAEALPFDDGRFDRVLSCFGAMFAPRPVVAAGEMVRVVRPGGTVALAGWTPDSFVGRLVATIGSFMPPRPDGVPEPSQWGVEDVVRARFAGLAADVRVERRAVSMQHASVDEMWDFQRRNTGPLVVAQTALGARFDELAQRVTNMIAELNRATDGSARVESDYLLVVATKPG